VRQIAGRNETDTVRRLAPGTRYPSVPPYYDRKANGVRVTMEAALSGRA
jgi:hypothetical protein